MSFKKQLSRREFLATTGAVILSSNVKCSMSAKRPNILWITCEDISPDLGCYGDPVARTPVLDKLASEGMRYTQAYSVSGVCAPSRSCLITGMYPTSIGTHHMRTTHRAPGLPTPYYAVPPLFVKGFPEYLRAAGYYCSNHRKTDYQFGEPMTIWDDCSDTAHWRNRAPGQPFFSVINHTITHESKIRVPIEKEVITDPNEIQLPPYYPDTPVVRYDFARYYDNIATMDSQVGEVLRQLDEDGLADNTIVFFFGDHGRGLPRAKRWIYDSGIQVPLIIRWPKHLQPGSVNDDLVSFVDFAPTVLSLAGVEIPSHIQGQPFLGKQAQPPRTYIYAARDRMDEQYDFIRAVRDKRFKYIRNFMPEKPYALEIPYMELMPTMQEWRRLNAEGKLVGPQKLFFQETKPVHELYDITTDPHEIHNLADDPKYKADLERLQKALQEWMERVGDMGNIPEKEMVEKMWPAGVQPQTVAPTITPDGGQFNRSTTVSICCATEGASIAYTTDAGIHRHWLLYSKPIMINKNVTLRAKAIRYGYKHSKESRAVFKIEL